ncbi:MAG TPA: hypothetical protein VFU41_09005 [Gemmatimonadales bacterium]|nr:hypothetical protein [Gemmatimonadales bacterium]
MRRAARLGACAIVAGALPMVAGAQGYRLRVDTRMQAAAYRGVTLDSIPVSDTATGPTGGPVTPDGFAVTCIGSDPYCRFFRPGPVVNSAPITATADLTLWSLGLPGLSIRATGRLAGDLSSADNWPGTDSHAQLLEGYADYSTERLSAQIGRQTVPTRFGFTGFDGGRLALRTGQQGLELAGYGGWGLARSAALPVTSPALNPLDDFQPLRRQLVAGAAAGWTSTYVDARLDYLREVDPRVDYFVSERAGVDLAVRPYAGWSLTGGADYDLAAGWWGSAEATLGYAAPSGRVAATAGVRRYRPHFALWTIWGAFSPVPYRAVEGSVSFAPVAKLRIRARGQAYEFDEAEVSTPLVMYETSGWRFSWGSTYSPSPRWTLDGGYHAEFGPGASSRGLEGAVTFTPGEVLVLGLHGSTLDRPLEFRFDQASLRLYGVQVLYRPSPRTSFQLDASRYAEDRERPDAAAFDWNQVRVSARVVLLFGGGADVANLPPAVRRMPGGRTAR